VTFTLSIRIAEELAAEQAAALVAHASRLIQAHIDATAQERGYFDALACVSYRGGEEEPVWAAEAEAFHRWRTQIWRSAHQLLADVQSGVAAPPANEAELFARLNLPPMVWQ
jgi:argininosuccinate lyase